eukprot:scaffold53614_cov23-Tisochrysis_lutea.AAC.1
MIVSELSVMCTLQECGGHPSTSQLGTLSGSCLLTRQNEQDDIAHRRLGPCAFAYAAVPGTGCAAVCWLAGHLCWQQPASGSDAFCITAVAVCL